MSTRRVAALSNRGLPTAAPLHFRARLRGCLLSVPPLGVPLQAYRTLSDEDERRTYDEKLLAATRGNAGHGAAAQGEANPAQSAALREGLDLLKRCGPPDHALGAT